MRNSKVCARKKIFIFLLTAILIACSAALVFTGVGVKSYLQGASSLAYTAQDIVNLNGDPESGTTYVVSDAAGLQNLESLVNQGKNFSGIIIRMTADVDMQGKTFTGIGSFSAGNAFAGTFDGNGHVISNLTLNDTAGGTLPASVGLFGYTSSATLLNLTLADVQISMSSSGTSIPSGIGGIVGKMTGGSIENCSVSGSISIGGASAYTGGIAGLTGEAVSGGVPVIADCTSKVNITGFGAVGGIVGGAVGGVTVRGCINTGKLTCDNTDSPTAIANCTAGGMIGSVVQNGSQVVVEKSRNNGTMSIYRAYAVGGLVGSVTSLNAGTVDIVESVNQAKITATAKTGADGSVNECKYVGGLVGEISGGNVTLRESGYIDSQNAGSGSSAAYSLTSQAQYTGGIVGYLTGSSVRVDACYNRVAVSGSGKGEAIGGLIGWGESVNLKNSYNRGGVTVSNQISGVGGLAGKLAGGSILNSYNAGALTIGNAIDYAGGLVGVLTGSDAEVVNATNYGGISVESTGAVSGGVSGLVGSAQGAKIKNSFNGENILANTATNVVKAGLLAAGTATVERSYSVNTLVLFADSASVTSSDCERFDGNGTLLSYVGGTDSLTEALNLWISTNNTLYGGALISRKVIKIESSSKAFPMYVEKVGEYALAYEEDYLNFLKAVNDGNAFNGIKIYLMRDITLTQTGGMQPIGSDVNLYFGGTFDGNGHTLTLTSIVNDSLNSSANTGLFGYVKNATIRDLTVKTVSDNAITSKDGYLGGIAGTSENSQITGVSFLGKLSYTKGSVGGIVGKAIGGSITGCYSDAVFSSAEDSARAGGILGESSGADTWISYCYSLSDITRGLIVAGIYAGDVQDVQIDNCYSVGKISGAQSAAGIGKANVTASYYLTGKVTAPTVVGEGVELTYAQMSDDCSGLEGFVFGRKGLYGGWYVYSERGYGYLPQLTPFATLGSGGQISDSLQGVSGYKQLIRYRIDLDLGGGSTQGDVPETYTVNSGQIDILAAVRGGYKFLGWSGTGISGRVNSVTIAANSVGHVSYKANWELITYTVQYGNLTDEEIVYLANPTEYSAETTPVQLRYPARDYYEFAGWRDAVSNVLYPTVTLPMTDNFGDKQLNAEFKPTEYKITYANMGGGKLPANAPETYNVESSIAVQGEPTRNGYVFKGWEVSGEQDLQRIILIQKGSHGDKTYTAVWQLVEYTIRYEGVNAGEINGTNPLTYSIETAEFTLINPVRRGYDFKGWQEMNGSGTHVTVTIRPGEKYGNIIFTATWQPSVYQIKYNLYDGAYEGGKTNPATYTVLDTFTLINPYKAGYTFVGWILGEDSSPKKEYTISDRVGALEFSAIYEKNYTALDHKSADGKTSLVKVERQDGFDIYSVFKVTELDVSTLPPTVGERIGKNNEVKSVYRLYFEDREQPAKVAYVQTRYGIIPVADASTPEITVSIYGAVKNGMLMQLADDGSITPIQAQVSGSYYIFNSTEALGTFLVIAPTSIVKQAFEGENLWITVGIIGGVVGLACILLLLKYTFLRRYTITFRGARIKRLKLKKGSAITLPSAYEWYSDPECKVRFTLKVMPKRNLRLYTNTSKEDSEYRTAPALRQKYAGGGQAVKALPAGSYQANQNALGGRMNVYNMQAGASPYGGANPNGQYIDWQRQQQMAAQNAAAAEEERLRAAQTVGSGENAESTLSEKTSPSVGGESSAAAQESRVLGGAEKDTAQAAAAAERKPFDWLNPRTGADTAGNRTAAGSNPQQANAPAYGQADGAGQAESLEKLQTQADAKGINVPSETTERGGSKTQPDKIDSILSQKTAGDASSQSPAEAGGMSAQKSAAGAAIMGEPARGGETLTQKLGNAGDAFSQKLTGTEELRAQAQTDGVKLPDRFDSEMLQRGKAAEETLQYARTDANGSPLQTLADREARTSRSEAGSTSRGYDSEMLRRQSIRQAQAAEEALRQRRAEKDAERRARARAEQTLRREAETRRERDDVRQPPRSRKAQAHGYRAVGGGVYESGQAQRSAYGGQPKRRYYAEPVWRKESGVTGGEKAMPSERYARYAQQDRQPPKIRRKKPVPRYTAVTADVLERRRDARRKGFRYNRYDDYIVAKPRGSFEQQQLEALRAQWELHLLQENADIRRAIEEERQRMKSIEKVARQKQFESLIAAREGLTLKELNALRSGRAGGKRKKPNPKKSKNAVRAGGVPAGDFKARKTSALNADLDNLRPLSDPDGYLDGLEDIGKTSRAHGAPQGSGKGQAGGGSPPNQT